MMNAEWLGILDPSDGECDLGENDCPEPASVPRSNLFKGDPSLPPNFNKVIKADYVNSGYSRGHLAPAGDRSRTTKDDEATFYMTNMLPQKQNMNNGMWKRMEEFERRLIANNHNNELYVFAGGLGEIGRIGDFATGIVIPEFFWKTILLVQQGQKPGEVEATAQSYNVIMPNMNMPPSFPFTLTMPDGQDKTIANAAAWSNWTTWQVTIDRIEAIVDPIPRPDRFNLYSSLRNNVEDAIESRIDVPELPFTAGTTEITTADPNLLNAANPALTMLADAARQTWETTLGMPFPFPVQIAIADLSGQRLAESHVWYAATGLPSGGSITIDVNAAGSGWYLDTTPFDASEFVRTGAGGELLANFDSPAATDYDLYTVLLHEFGHLAGFDSHAASFARYHQEVEGQPVFSSPKATALLSPDGNHLDGDVHHGDLLEGTLTIGTRRLPSGLDAAILRAVWDLTQPDDEDYARSLDELLAEDDPLHDLRLDV
jgi:DNA/RNA endonuclease G (NUC1)